MLTQLSGSADRFALLSAKQREVMDLLCANYSHKEIARRLQISVRTIEQRVSAVRSTLGIHDRREAIRVYRKLRDECGLPTCGSPLLDSPAFEPLAASSDEGLDPVFTLSDASGFDQFWVERESASSPGDPAIWGRAWRFFLIVAIAIGIAAAVALAVATANGLNALL